MLIKPTARSGAHHVDHAERGEEERGDGRHERVDGREDVVERVVRHGRDGADAGRRVDVRGDGLGAEVALRERVRRAVEPAAAGEHVLHLRLVVLGLREERDLVLRPLTEGMEPNEGADERDADGVEDERDVEDVQPDGDVVRLDDRADGDDPCDEEEDAEREAGWGGTSVELCDGRGTVMATAPLRSWLEMVKFSMKSGARQTMEKAMQMTPAASRQRSMRIQVPIRRLDGILAWRRR
jgi:hypothetical protein